MEGTMERRLYRSRKWRVFGGVAGGLAEYFNLDPILMRVIFVIVTLLHGFGILLYIILWIVIPEVPFEIAYKVNSSADQESDKQQENYVPEPKQNAKGRIIIGGILIAIGVLFFVERLFPSFDFEDVLPMVLIAIGLVLVWNSTRK
jgi:phage shock protein PspC (stress-responsive transcriptional regulator)